MSALPDPGPEGEVPEVTGLRFGVFEMDFTSGEIRRSGVLVRLPPQPFRLLALLARRSGEVLTREAIREQLWTDGTVVEFDHRLNSCINQIRGILGDDAEVPRYVETLPRRGYRWIGPAEVVRRATSPPDARSLRLASPVPRRDDEAFAGLSTQRGRRSQPGWLAPAALVLAGSALALLAVGVFSWLRPEPVAQWTRLTFRRGYVTAARFGRSGEVLYSAAWEGQPAALYSARSQSIDERALDVGGAEVVGVSPQGEVAFRTKTFGMMGVLARAPLAGGSRKDILEKVVAADLAPDGATFAVAVRDGGKLRLEFPPGKTIHEVEGVGIADLRVSPDGRHLAYLEHPVRGDDRGRVVLLEAGGSRRVLSDDWASIAGLAWSAGGHEVWFTAARSGTDTTLYGVSLSGRLRTVLPSMGRMVLYDIGPDGRILLDRITLRAGISFGREGVPERELAWFDMPNVTALTADGARLLFTESGEGGGREYAIYLRKTDGAPPVRIGAGHATDLSPDGHWALAIPVSTRERIDVLPTGAGTARTIKDPGFVEYVSARFFPDGGRILFVAREQGCGRRLYVRSLATGPARPFAREGDSSLVITPDGRSVLAPCKEKGECLQPVEGGEGRPVPGLEGLAPLWWDASGRTLYARETGSQPAVIYRLDTSSGKRELWRTLAPSDSVGVYGISGIVGTPDGAAWAYSYIRGLSEVFVVEGLR